MNGRLYDAKLHRFLQPDNYVQDPSNTQNYNRYGYCWNNPLKFTDPSGEWIWIVVGAVVGGIVNWAAHGAQFNMEGLKAFGIGAGAGALAGIVGPAAFTAVGGGVAGAGGFVAGAIGGAAASAASQIFLTVGNYVAFGDSLMFGKEFIVGVAFGAALGGTLNGVSALKNGNTFWRGTPPRITPQPISIHPAGLVKTGEVSEIKTDVKIANTTQTSTVPTTQNNTATAINKELGVVLPKNSGFGIPDQSLADNVAHYNKLADPFLDCSDITSSMNKSTDGGRILEITSKSGNWINGMEYGQKTEFTYHQVVQKGGFIFDPMFSNKPVLSSTYWNAYKNMNPEGINIFKL
jgi:hypothetical protein